MIRIWPLKALDVVSSQGRDTSVDVFRGLAILGVIFFHTGVLEFGYLGVDLFFVISGFLIGGILIDACTSGCKISVLRFFLSRGFKIWPSYYAFLLFGSALAWAALRNRLPGELIPWSEWPRYLLFYRNYRGGSHWSFDHLWSLCVEEHFYLLLPALLVSGTAFFGQLTRKRLLALFGALVAAGVAGKCLSYATHRETYSATHNRLDALAWGGLLYLAVKSPGFGRMSAWHRACAFLICLASLLGMISMVQSGSGTFYEQVVFWSSAPICFAGMLLSLIGVRLPYLLPLRLIAYYSYNWYLWHALFATLWFGHAAEGGRQAGLARVALYMAASFLAAIVFTIGVEEPFLELRKRVMARRPRAAELIPARSLEATGAER